MTIGAIVLAAGKSERMGSPKALLKLGQETFLERILGAIGQSSIEQTVVVVGRHRDEIHAAHPDLPLVVNPTWEQGMTTSLQAGIRALPQGIEGAVLFLVDHPWIEASTIRALVTRLEPGGIVVPVFEGRRGHPVVFSIAVLEEILALGADQGANTVVRRVPARVVEVPIDTPGILRDIDTAGQFEALRAEWNAKRPQ